MITVARELDREATPIFSVYVAAFGTEGDWVSVPVCDPSCKKKLMFIMYCFIFYKTDCNLTLGYGRQNFFYS